MISVVIAALSGTASIGTAGFMDALNKADLAGRLRPEAPRGRAFDARLAGLQDGPVNCHDGVSLHPSVLAADVAQPDLVVVPGLDDNCSTANPRHNPLDVCRRVAPTLPDGRRQSG
jgi:hypothetical protein